MLKQLEDFLNLVAGGNTEYATLQHKAESILLKLHNERTSFSSHRDQARAKYADPSSNDIEVDDDCFFSEADDGVWVSAWLWVPSTTDDEDTPITSPEQLSAILDAEDQAACEDERNERGYRSRGAT